MIWYHGDINYLSLSKWIACAWLISVLVVSIYSFLCMEGATLDSVSAFYVPNTAIFLTQEYLFAVCQMFHIALVLDDH